MSIHDHKVFCLMNSGKPLTTAICDVLLLNAYDMYFEGLRRQRIKSSAYDGVIDSDLEPIQHHGVPGIVFEAILSTDKWDVAEIDFFVRIEDFDDVNEGEWVRLISRVMGPLSFGELPEHVQQMMLNHGHTEDDQFEVNVSRMESMEEEEET